MFDGTDDWCKILKKNEFFFPKWHEEFGKFLQAEKQWFYFRKKNGGTKSNEKFETTRSTRCGEKCLFYFGNKWVCAILN